MRTSCSGQPIFEDIDAVDGSAAALFGRIWSRVPSARRRAAVEQVVICGAEADPRSESEPRTGLGGYGGAGVPKDALHPIT